MQKSLFEPKMIGIGSRSSRVNRSGGELNKNNDFSSMLSNISSGVSPINYDEKGSIGVSDAIKLCQKAYWNVSIFKLTIDIMAEFANSNLRFKSKNKVAVSFFEEWYKKINGHNVAGQYFTELFRGSNVFQYRLNGTMKKNSSSFPVQIPLKYILLNPADIRCNSAVSFVDGVTYNKVLNEFEIEVLKNSKDEKNLQIKKSLPIDVQKKIEKGEKLILMPLNPDDLIVSFFKKQDYEPLAVPMYFPVLFDIDLKLEFKKAEHIIARACEYMILLINVGDKDVDVDQAIVDSIQTMFKSESVGRVLVSDWTTKMSFIMPDLEKILGPEKYTSVNNDIANGLMNIFFGDQKYADSMIKIKVFIERLKEARQVYLNSFLIPEIESICQKMGFREAPTPYFEEVDLKNEVEYMKIYNRMAELGILTPEETIEAHKTNILPEAYDSIVSQEKIKSLRDKGLYLPAQTPTNQSGRPTGTPQNQKDKTVTPIGQGSCSFSIEKLKDVAKKADDLINLVGTEYKNKNGIARIRGKSKNIVISITSSIISNEKINDWESKVSEYVSGGFLNENGPEFDKVTELAAIHNLDYLSAALLHNSRL